MIEKTCIIIGTRPEIIKMSPVVRAAGAGLVYGSYRTRGVLVMWIGSSLGCRMRGIILMLGQEGMGSRLGR